MAWSYASTHEATSTVTSRSYGSDFSQSITQSITSIQGNSTITVQFTTEAAGSFHGSNEFLGTGGARWTTTYTTTATTGTLTSNNWDEWALRISTENRTITSHAISMQTLVVSIGTNTDTSFRTQESSTVSFSSFFDGLLGSMRTSSSGFTISTFISSTNIGFSNSAGVRATVTGSASGSTTGSTSGSFHSFRQYIYTSSTASDSISFVNTVTTASIQTYTFPISSTSGTASSSSTTNATTTTTAASTSSVVSYLTGSFTRFILLDTIFHADSTDWAWSTSASGNGLISSLAGTITDATISQGAFGVVLSTWTPVTASYASSVNNAGSTAPNITITETFVDINSTSSTFSRRTTASSTYEIGAATTGSAEIPLTGRQTITRHFTTTTQTTFTFESTSSATDTFTVEAYKSLVSFSYIDTATMTSTRTGEITTFVTTFAQGTFYNENDPEVFHLTVGSLRTASFSGITASSFSSVSNYTIFRELPDNGSTSSVDYNQNLVSVISADTVSFLEANVAGGFQAWGSVAFGGTYGTNLSANTPIQILSFGRIFDTVIVPLMDGETRAFTVGTDALTSQWVPSASEVHVTSLNSSFGTVGLTLSIFATGSIANDKSSINSTASTIGGYGWHRSSSDFSQLSASVGMHSYTSYDSALGSTVATVSWNAVNSTLNVSHGNAINIETSPLISIVRTDITTDNEIVLTFEAFPVT